MPAATTISYLGGAAGVATHVIPPYYADFLRDNLYPNLYFRQLGTQVTVPRGYGDTVRIPRWQTPIKTSGSVAAISGSISAIEPITEGTSVTVQSLCAQSITGQVKQYGGARGYSDKLIIVTKANFIEGALESLARDARSRNRIEEVNSSRVSFVNADGGETISWSIGNGSAWREAGGLIGMGLIEETKGLAE